MHSTGDHVGLSVTVRLNANSSVPWVVVAGLGVVWCCWTSVKGCFTNSRVLCVPWNRRPYSGWFLWEWDVARPRGEDGGGIGEGIEVIEKPINGGVAGDWAAPGAWGGAMWWCGECPLIICPNRVVDGCN